MASGTPKAPCLRNDCDPSEGLQNNDKNYKINFSIYPVFKHGKNIQDSGTQEYWKYNGGQSAQEVGMGIKQTKET